MHSYYKMYGSLVAITTGLFVAISDRVTWLYDVLGLNKDVLVVLSIIIGSVAPALTLKALIKLRFVRQRVFGRSWIEGWWVLLTHTADRQHEYQGFLEIRYDAELQLRAFAYYNYSGPFLDKLAAESVYLTIDPNSLQYINRSTVFVMPTYQSIAFGKMYLDQNRNYPTLYHGRRVEIDNPKRSEDGVIPTWQDMAKIPQKIVRSFQTRYKEEWKVRLLDSEEYKVIYRRASRKNSDHFDALYTPESSKSDDLKLESSDS